MSNAENQEGKVIKYKIDVSFIDNETPIIFSGGSGEDNNQFKVIITNDDDLYFTNDTLFASWALKTHNKKHDTLVDIANNKLIYNSPLIFIIMDQRGKLI